MREEEARGRSNEKKREYELDYCEQRPFARPAEESISTIPTWFQRLALPHRARHRVLSSESLPGGLHGAEHGPHLAQP